MPVIGKNKLTTLLNEADDAKRLYVTPLLDNSQVGASSIDIRLGNDFIVTKSGNISLIDPAREDVGARKHQEIHFTNFGEKFYLHPNELVLAGTLEYFKLPNDVSGYVTSRSSWGRVGLVIATATIIHAGFSGTITLELVNLGKVPLVLYPGLRVAQIVLMDCQDAEAYRGQYSNQTKALAPDVSRNDFSELSYWTKYPT